MHNPLDYISRSGALFILVLSSGKAEVFSTKSKSPTLVCSAEELANPKNLEQFATESLRTPWVVLVDQSEESFWGGVIPKLRGAAKAVWLNRLAEQSGSDSPYRWSDVQGKSRSQSGKFRVLGYTLGRPEVLTPWLDALKHCGARIRGVYSPVMLTGVALQSLQIKPPKEEDDISILVTPHADGLRQSVLVGGQVRFSRLALNPQTQGADWFEAVYQETIRLREYLISNGLLKSDRAGMHIYAVLPTTAENLRPSLSDNKHPKDRYQWVTQANPTLVYVAALCRHQSWEQLAPAAYRKHDISLVASRLLYWGSLVTVGLTTFYLLIMLVTLWLKQSDISAAKADANNANQLYLKIAKTFPQTPLTAVQLIEMNKRWTSLKESSPPEMRDALIAAGQTLERHPNMLVESFLWIANVTDDGFSEGEPIVKPANPTAGTDDKKQKRSVTSLLLRGSIQGVASDDLRGARDALSRLEADFNRNPKIRAEIIKTPFDLSAKSSFTGSGTQDKSELNFEIKLWQR